MPKATKNFKSVKISYKKTLEEGEIMKAKKASMEKMESPKMMAKEKMMMKEKGKMMKKSGKKN